MNTYRFQPLATFSGLLLMLVVLSGCNSVNYATQAWQGNRDLMRMAVPIETLLADPQTDPALAARLELALEARRFASEP